MTPTSFRSRYVTVSLLAVLLWGTSQGLRPFVALRLVELGYSTAEVGVAVAAFASLSLVLALPAGRLVDRMPAAWLVLAALLIQAGLAFGYARATAFVPIILLQLTQGVAFMVAWLGIQAIVMTARSGPFLQFHLALFSLAWGIGQALGPIFGGVAFERFGFATLAYGVGVTLVVASLLAIALPRSSHRVTDRVGESEATGATRPSAVGDLRGLAGDRSVRLVALAAFTAISVESIRNSFYPILLDQAGYSGSQVGLLLATAAIASLAVRGALPLIRRRSPATTVLLVSTAVGVLGLSLTPAFLLVGLPPLLIGAGMMGVGNGLNPPITLELMASDVAARTRGMATAIRAMSNRLANLAQPLIFSGLIAGIGIRASFPVVGTGLGACIVLMARAVGQRSRDHPTSPEGSS